MTKSIGELVGSSGEIPLVGGIGVLNTLTTHTAGLIEGIIDFDPDGALDAIEYPQHSDFIAGDYTGLRTRLALLKKYGPSEVLAMYDLYCKRSTGKKSVSNVDFGITFQAIVRTLEVLVASGELLALPIPIRIEFYTGTRFENGVPHIISGERHITQYLDERTISIVENDSIPIVSRINAMNSVYLKIADGSSLPANVAERIWNAYSSLLTSIRNSYGNYILGEKKSYFWIEAWKKPELYTKTTLSFISLS